MGDSYVRRVSRGIEVDRDGRLGIGIIGERGGG